MAVECEGACEGGSVFFGCSYRADHFAVLLPLLLLCLNLAYDEQENNSTKGESDENIYGVKTKKHELEFVLTGQIRDYFYALPSACVRFLRGYYIVTGENLFFFLAVAAEEPSADEGS